MANLISGIGAFPSLSLRASDFEDDDGTEDAAKPPAIIHYHPTRAKSQYGCVVSFTELIMEGKMAEVYNLVKLDEAKFMNNPALVEKIRWQRKAVGTCLQDLKDRDRAVKFVELGGLAVIDAVLDVKHAVEDEDHVYLTLQALHSILFVRRTSSQVDVPLSYAPM
jgi:hypothetical protein